MVIFHSCVKLPEGRVNGKMPDIAIFWWWKALPSPSWIWLKSIVTDGKRSLVVWNMAFIFPEYREHDIHIYIFTYISNIYWWYHILYYPIYFYVPSYMGWDNPKPIDEVHHFSSWLFRNHVSLGGPLSRSSKACAASSLENGFFPFSSAKVLNPLFQKYTRRLLQADFSGPRRHPKDFPEFLMFLMKKVS